MEYLDFRNLVTEACNKMIKENKHLFILDTQKEFLWMAYMESFPEGAVRQEFNCVNCKHFITRYGALVSVDENYKIHSYWEDLKQKQNSMELFILMCMIKTSLIKAMFQYQTLLLMDMKLSLLRNI